MKLRLVLQTTTRSNKEVSIKLNVAPKKHLGLINFIELALKQDLDVLLTFEKISKSGKREESKVYGKFKFNSDNLEELEDLRKQIEVIRRKRKKRHQKRVLKT